MGNVTVRIDKDGNAEFKGSLSVAGNLNVGGQLTVGGKPIANGGGMTAPIGTIMAFAGDWPPRKPAGVGNWQEDDLDWMGCDGRALPNNTKYNPLFNAIGIAWGDGSTGAHAQPGTTKFNLPDLRGVFLRGVNGDATMDPNANDRKETHAGGNSGNRVGSFQTDQFKEHTHTVIDPGHDHPMGNFAQAGNIYGAGNGRSAWSWFGAGILRTGKVNTGISVGDAGGSETRPVNAAVYWIIRYR